jgi:hypothetical protein
VVRLACATAVALVAGASAPSQAIAQEQRESAPTAEHLWRSYPLEERAGAAERTPVAASNQSPSPTRMPSDAGGGEDDGDEAGSDLALGAALLVLVAPLLLLLALAGVATLLARRGRPPVDAPAASPRALAVAAVARAPRDASLQFAEPALRMSDGKRFSRRRTEPRPPDVDAHWSAELRWVQAESTAWFQAVASPMQGGTEVELAQSPSMPWPLDGKAAKELSAAVGRLEESLLAAGWRPLARGDAWYARRFGWDPAARHSETVPLTDDEEREIAALFSGAPARGASSAPSATPTRSAAPTRSPTATRSPAPAPSPRLTPRADPVSHPAAQPAARVVRAQAWPDDTHALWRCEIRWQGGWKSSYFEAMARPPRKRPGRRIATSPGLKWMLKGDPDPIAQDCRAALTQLCRGLVAAGWESAGCGHHWYAVRFVWRQPGAPPALEDMDTSEETVR